MDEAGSNVSVPNCDEMMNKYDQRSLDKHPNSMFCIYDFVNEVLVVRLAVILCKTIIYKILEDHVDMILAYLMKSSSHNQLSAHCDSNSGSF